MSVQYKEIEEAMLGYLDTLDQQKRVEKIDDLMHRLNFEKRVTLLTDKERENLEVSLSDSQRENLSKAKTEKEKERIIEELARAHFFVRSAWIDYLNGVTDEKPFCSNEEDVAA